MRRALSSLRLVLFASAAGLALVACGGDDNGGAAPPTSSTTPTMQTFGFEPYAQQLVTQSTCDTNTPVTTNVTFVYAADQDTADPRSLSTVVAGCTM